MSELQTSFGKNKKELLTKEIWSVSVECGRNRHVLFAEYRGHTMKLDYRHVG